MFVTQVITIISQTLLEPFLALHHGLNHLAANGACINIPDPANAVLPSDITVSH